MTWVRISLALFILIALPECTSRLNRQTLRFKGLEPTTKIFSGILTLPEASQQKVPVVILFHGTAGPDSRYEFHRPALLEAGMATLEVDYKSNIYTCRRECNNVPKMGMKSVPPMKENIW